MAENCFPMVRGKKIRVTELDSCYNPTDSTVPAVTPPPVPRPVRYVTTSGVISIALTSNIDEGDEVNVKNMDGSICVLDKPCPRFTGYNIEFTFCNVCPCLWSLITGQSTVLNAELTEPVGMRMNAKADTCLRPFALEMWTGVPGKACGATPGSGLFGYLLLPAVQPGVVGDFTVENNSITFTVTAAVTKDGNNWGDPTVPAPPLPARNNIKGLWPVADGLESPPGSGSFPDSALLSEYLQAEDHLHLQYTHQAPPAESDGCDQVMWTPGTPLVTPVI